MRWGIVFKIPPSFESDLWGLPPPSQARMLKSRNTKKIEVFYHFLHNPQSWKEWQRVAAIKVQMKQRVPNIEFIEYERPQDMDSVKFYTIKELGEHFKGFVRFPKPMFPYARKEGYKMLCRHAKRLHYEGKLHIEQLIATSMRFNAADPEGIRQTIRRAKAAYLFALDHEHEWKTKLSPEELKQSKRRGAKIAAHSKNVKNQDKKIEAKEMRDQGMSLREIADILNVSHMTIKSWLK